MTLIIKLVRSVAGQRMCWPHEATTSERFLPVHDRLKVSKRSRLSRMRNELKSIIHHYFFPFQWNWLNGKSFCFHFMMTQMGRAACKVRSCDDVIRHLRFAQQIIYLPRVLHHRYQTGFHFHWSSPDRAQFHGRSNNIKFLNVLWPATGVHGAIQSRLRFLRLQSELATVLTFVAVKRSELNSDEITTKGSNWRDDTAKSKHVYHFRTMRLLASRWEYFTSWFNSAHMKIEFSRKETICLVCASERKASRGVFFNCERSKNVERFESKCE